MHTARIVFTVMMALIFMGCPPPVSDNSASESNAPPQSGDNSAFGDNAPEPQPKAIVVDRVSAGGEYTMIVKSDDTLWAVGKNAVGQLGNGKDGADVVELIPVKVMPGVKQVSAGGAHTMILKTNDELWAVGRNGDGQLGDGSTNSKSTAVQVKEKVPAGETTAMTEVDQVSAGGAHTMILKKNGSLWAVGWNLLWQLGNGGRNEKKLIPVKVLTAPGNHPMTEVASVSVGGSHTMILKENGDLWAVGTNSHGQLGDDSTNSKSTAVQVKTTEGEPMDNVDQVSAGGQHSMILKENGELWAVGLNDHGQLGDGSTNSKSTPVAVRETTLGGGIAQPMTAVAQVSAGGFHTMIVKENGELWAVGDNQYGQLGDGTTNQRSNPVQVKTADGRPMTEVASVSAGESHTVVVTTGGTLWAFGRNNYGQLGNGNSGDDAVELIPVEITVE